MDITSPQYSALMDAIKEVNRRLVRIETRQARHMEHDGVSLHRPPTEVHPDTPAPLWPRFKEVIKHIRT